MSPAAHLEAWAARTLHACMESGEGDGWWSPLALIWRADEVGSVDMAHMGGQQSPLCLTLGFCTGMVQLATLTPYLYVCGVVKQLQVSWNPWFFIIPLSLWFKGYALEEPETQGWRGGGQRRLTKIFWPPKNVGAQGILDIFGQFWVTFATGKRF